ncbi:unnamed protein product [Colias eurytheme]|nr:unnamed protein product [Colias eurytheme]
MTLLSVVIITIFFIINVRSEVTNEIQSPIQKLKDLISKGVKEQSIKINNLLNTIESNAKIVLQKLHLNQKEEIKTSSGKNLKNEFSDESKLKRRIMEDTVEHSKKSDYQIESPIASEVKEETSSRSFGSVYPPTGYGVSATANFGVPTYHHHSIGFDPINIVVSMSLISFMLQALQGLLNRARFPTPVIEAKSLEPSEKFLKNLREKKTKKYRKDFFKKYKFYKT